MAEKAVSECFHSFPYFFTFHIIRYLLGFLKDIGSCVEYAWKYWYKLLAWRLKAGRHYLTSTSNILCGYHSIYPRENEQNVGRRVWLWLFLTGEI